ncbi:MAG: exodeoxyribonuclease VII large subunit, partial [Pseudomonadota bacterium]
MVASDDTLGWPFDEAEDEAPPRPNVVEYSVSEISFALKRTVEDTFGYVRIRGELGRVSRPASGHVYLDLK